MTNLVHLMKMRHLVRHLVNFRTVLLQIMFDLMKLSSKYYSVPLQSHYVHKMPAIGNMAHLDQLYSPFWILRSSMYICDFAVLYMTLMLRTLPDYRYRTSVLFI
ncbi:hypothetical protein PVAP13_J127801 [Panicum virgatum]|nr:hypothetical protein PVAP13_J127801 [Panicum virgatum]